MPVLAAVIPIAAEAATAGAIATGVTTGVSMLMTPHQAPQLPDPSDILNDDDDKSFP